MSTRFDKQHNQFHLENGEQDQELLFENLKIKVSPNFWSSDFAIDSSIFNTFSIVKSNIVQHETFLNEINKYVYFRINKNFTEFYKMVQKLNKFDMTARAIVNDIELIRNQFSGAKMLIQSDIIMTQLKIRRRIMLKEVLKIFETIKYIDKANSTIKNLFEKTDFRKISELLVVLKSGFDNKLRMIKIFENKFEEINRLKESFIENLIKMALNQIESCVYCHLADFKEYVRSYSGDPNETSELMGLEVKEQGLDSVHSILIELRLFNEINLSKETSSNFSDIFHKFTREIVNEISKRIVFKNPSINLLKSYRNLVKTIFMSYRYVFSGEKDKDIIKSIVNILIKNTNSFFKKVFDIFDLHVISTDEIRKVIDLINSFSSVFLIEADSVFWQLQLYFKKLILNAKQQSFFQVLRKSMEDETWTSAEITEESEIIIRQLLKGCEFEIFSKFVRIGREKYSLSSSFLMLIIYFRDLKEFEENIGNIGTEFFTKIKETVTVYFTNSENLILKTGAVHLQKLTKINTKMLGFLNSLVSSPN